MSKLVNQFYQHQHHGRWSIRMVLILLVTLMVAHLAQPLPIAGAMWSLSDLLGGGVGHGLNQSTSARQQQPFSPSNLAGQLAASSTAVTSPQPMAQQLDTASGTQQVASDGGTLVGNGAGASSYANYGQTIMSIAGIQPSSIASILNTVGDTGFRYFNIQDQCRNRAACDLGAMLYKRLSFVHNWLIRTSVRSLTDMNNLYTQSWMEGMLGRNCTSVYTSCRQSPLEGIMNLAVLQHAFGG